MKRTAEMLKIALVIKYWKATKVDGQVEKVDDKLVIHATSFSAR